ncbi:MAG TPA: SBBP repeat-containing protein [Bacteroidia bacterium]|nr:SBBP repeat-containing protein [Bacteroidia bacterium]
MCWFPLVAFTMLFLFSLHSFSQAPNWLWAKRTGGTSIDYTNDVAADAFGNSYITGTYSSAPITFGAATLTNSGLSDVFLVKYNAAGNVIWARKIGNTGSEFGQSVATDAAGNIYIAGSFNSPSIVIGSITLTSAGSSDVFVAKYDSAGNALWARRAGSTGLDGASAIAVTPAGDVYIGGSYISSSITFGPNTLPNFGYNDAFVAKYNTSGTALWGKHIGEYLDEFVSSIAVDAAGNVIAAGVYNSIDVLIGSTVLITNAQDAVFDIFLAKFSPTGTVLWARGAGGWEDDFANGAAVDAAGNVYITGYVVSNPSTFGTISITTGAFALYLAKYNSAGTIQWVVAPGFGDGMNVTTDACGDIYWTGDFGGNITFGSTTLIQSGGGDIFVAKYNASGSPLWAMKAGGTNYETGQSITVSASNNDLLLAGQYQSPSIAFGSTTLTNVNVDGFVSRIAFTCTMVPLPVEMLSFTAVPVDNSKVRLNWITATEINCDFFTVERSLDTHEWESVTQVDGHGNSNAVLKYETWDYAPYSGTSYYHLKQTDYNGQFYYSGIEAVRITADGELLLSPNPATDFIYMFSPDENSNREADIVNVLGETVIRIKNQDKIDISHLSNGIYFLRAKTGESLTIQKFIKQ